MAFISRGIFRLILFLTGYVIFLCIGATVFLAIEQPEETQLAQEFRTLRYNFLEKNQCVEDHDLENLILEIIKASKRGVSAIGNATGEPNWSFGKSLFFTSTIVTTIGYGHVTPLSRSGKIFCIIYAVTGIPLTLVLLSALVERLLRPTLWLLKYLNSKFGHLYQPFKIRIIHLIIIITILVVFFLLIPAGIFYYLEPEWDYLDSVYYCFVSLTTIGLGDFVPGDSIGQPYRPLYKILITVYLFMGITYMMLALAVFYDIPQLNLELLFTPSEEDDESEKVRLATSVQSYNTSGGAYPSEHRQVVRIRSRRDDDDDESPEESGHRPLRIP